MGDTHGSGAVVVPAISAPSSVACLRSLGKRGIGTVAVSGQASIPAFRSKYCDEAVVAPSPHVDTIGYRDGLLELVKRPDIRTIVPVREEDVYVLSKYEDEFETHVGTAWPSFERLRTVQDRKHLFDAAEKARISIPETLLLDQVDDWEREYIVKSRYTLLAEEYVGSPGAGAIPERETTTYLPRGEEPDVEELCESWHHVPIVQEYVPGTDEYGFFALYDRGEALATFQHRQVRGYKYCGGPSAYRESVAIPELEAAGRRLLDHLDWHGLAMVEFLRDEETGEFKLMEVNPRFWSSLPFTVQAGVDFPALYWSLTQGAPERHETDYVVGIGGHLLRGELLYLHSVVREDYPLVTRPSLLGAVRDVVESIVRQPRFDYLDADDPRPFIRDALNFATNGVGVGPSPDAVNDSADVDGSDRGLAEGRTS